jgi:glyoxylase-like metal-dependent hydrolase (beta-lactamase superfamily II)
MSAFACAYTHGMAQTHKDTRMHANAHPTRASVRVARAVHTVIYTHGHVDHVMGALALDASAAARGEAPPVVVAHAAVAARFDR